MGTPVIGSKIGGIPELISEDSGLLFDTFNKDSLKQAIIQMKSEYMKYNRCEIAAKANKRYYSQDYYTFISEIYS